MLNLHYPPPVCNIICKLSLVPNFTFFYTESVYFMPTPPPSPIPAIPAGATICAHTTCHVNIQSGVARTEVHSMKFGIDEHWHCEKQGWKCVCMCHKDYTCTLNHQGRIHQQACISCPKCKHDTNSYHNALLGFGK